MRGYILMVPYENPSNAIRKLDKTAERSQTRQ